MLIARVLVPDRPTWGALRVDPSFSIRGRAWEQLLSRERTGAEGSILQEGRAMEVIRGGGASRVHTECEKWGEEGSIRVCVVERDYGGMRGGRMVMFC